MLISLRTIFTCMFDINVINKANKYFKISKLSLIFFLAMFKSCTNSMNKEKEANESKINENKSVMCMKYSQCDVKEIMNLNKMNSEGNACTYSCKGTNMKRNYLNNFRIDYVELANPIIVVVDPIGFNQMKANEMYDYLNLNTWDTTVSILQQKY